MYDFYDWEGTSARKILDELPEDNSDIIVEVNSNGGLVTVGSEIYTILLIFV